MRRYPNFRRPAPKPMGPVDWILAVLATVIVTGLFLIFLAAALFAATAVKAHEAASGWSYPWECCSDRDCAEIDKSRVAFVTGGYLVDGKHFISQSQAKHSPDGRYHACFPRPDFLRCLFIPPFGS